MAPSWPVLAAFAFALALCWAWPSRLFFPDGLDAADVIDRSLDRTTAAYLTTQSPRQILYGLFMFGIGKLSRLAGATGRSIPLLIAANSLVCALGIGAFASVCLRLSASKRAAFFCATGLAFSGGWWMYASNLEDVPFAIVPAVFAYRSALSARQNGKKWWIAAGTWSGLAILAQGTSGVVVPAILALAMGDRNVRLRHVVGYLVSTVLIVVAFQVGVAAYVGTHTDVPFGKWLGAATTGAGEVVFLDHPRAFVRNLARIFVWAYTPWMAVAGGLALAIAVWSVARAARAKGGPVGAGRFLASAACWIVPTVLFAMWWMDEDTEFLVTALPAFWMLVAFATTVSAGRRLFLAVAIGFVGLLFTANLVQTAIPDSDPDNNVYIRHAAEAAKRSRPGDVFVTDVRDGFFWIGAHYAHLDVRCLDEEAGRADATTEDEWRDVILRIGEEAERTGNAVYLKQAGRDAADPRVARAFAETIDRYGTGELIPLGADVYVRVRIPPSGGGD